MFNVCDELARSVADTLFAGERAIDSAVTDLSRLPGSIAAVRLEARLPFGMGQGAMSDAAEALTLMIRARHHMARAHDRLREAGAEIGFDITAFGDVFPCPPAEAVLSAPSAPPAPSGDQPHIRLVA